MMSRRSGPSARNTSANQANTASSGRRPEIEGRREQHRLGAAPQGTRRLENTASSIEEAITPSTRLSAGTPWPHELGRDPLPLGRPDGGALAGGAEDRHRPAAAGEAVLRMREKPGGVDALAGERRHEGRADAEREGHEELQCWRKAGCNGLR